jgi:hypothetical protein
VRRALAVSLVCALLGSCGSGARPCLEDEECFAGEYCAAGGVCAVYDGRRRVDTVPGADAGRVRIPDAGNPFTPVAPEDVGADMDLEGEPDARRGEDGG